MANPTTMELKQGGMTYCRFYDSTTKSGQPDPNYVFANYTKQPMTVNGIQYSSPEHYFQAKKFEPGSPSHTAILNAGSPDDARKEAQRRMDVPNNPDIVKVGNPPAPKKFNKYDDMVDTIEQRCQDPAFKATLLATGDAYMLEDTYQGPPGARNKADKKWGGGPDGKGENLLGLALMQARNKELNKAVPPPNPLLPTTRAELEDLRAKAQAERDEIDAQVGAGNTAGKSLPDIKALLQPGMQASATHDEAIPNEAFLAKVNIINPAIESSGHKLSADGNSLVHDDPEQCIDIDEHGNLTGAYLSVDGDEAALSDTLTAQLMVQAKTLHAMGVDPIELSIARSDDLSPEEHAKMDRIEQSVKANLEKKFDTPENQVLRKSATFGGNVIPPPAPAAPGVDPKAALTHAQQQLTTASNRLATDVQKKTGLETIAKLVELKAPFSTYFERDSSNTIKMKNDLDPTMKAMCTQLLSKVLPVLANTGASSAQKACIIGSQNNTLSHTPAFTANLKAAVQNIARPTGPG